MAKDIDAFFESKKEYQIERDRKLAKKEKKAKALIEQQRLKKDEVKLEEELNNEDLVEDGAPATKKVKFAAPTEDDSSDEDLDENGGYFLNPLLIGKQKNGKKKDEDSEEWSDDDEDDKDAKKGKDKKKDGKLGKRKKRDEEDHDFFTNKEIEIVPQENFGDGDESMDSDDMAETRAIAKVMLRKKARSEIVDATYNRYSTFDDETALPSWFLDEEKRHYRPNLPITKE